MTAVREPGPSFHLPGRTRSASERPAPELPLPELLVELRERVEAYLARHLTRRSDVEDLTQEVFLAALRGRDGYRGEARPAAWVLGIARNKLLTFLRDEGRRRLQPDDGPGRTLLEGQLARIEGESGLDERGARLARCLERLPRGQRRLVRRFYEAGESAESIARDEGRSPGAVRMTLLRVRSVLRACMEAGR